MARRDEDQWEPLESLGDTGKTVAKNIRRIRKAKGLQYTQLAEQLRILGREVPTWGLRKIESGGRRVDADDLAAIAVALGVSPTTLLMPAWNDDGSEGQASDLVSITGWHKPITAGVVWDWLSGSRPLVHGTLTSFAAHAWPGWIRQRFEDMAAAAAGMRDILNRQRDKG